MRFPQKTYEKMLAIIEKSPTYDLLLGDKFREINTLNDYDKKNRWFGYYQRFGEEHLLWTLDWVIQEVREEREGGHEFFMGCGNGF